MATRQRSRWFVVKETYQNGLVATALAGLGGLATVVGVAGLIYPRLIADIPKYAWGIFLVIIVLCSFMIRIPKLSGKFTFEPGPWAVELIVGDLFDQGSGIVVTVNFRPRTAPARPRRRIRRATVHRAATCCSRLSACHTLRTP